MRTLRKIIVTIVLLGIVGGGVALLFMPQPIPADFATVAKGPLQVTIDGDGRTRVRDVYTVSSPLAGRVLRIERHVGDDVIAGETLLATIEPAEPTLLDVRSQRQAEAAVKAADAAQTLSQSELDQANAELAFAMSDYERARSLAQRGAISQRALEQAHLSVQSLEAAVATREAALRVREFELETARAMLVAPTSARGGGEGSGCCVVVRAPVTGKVLRVLQESEAVVAAGTPLIEIGDPADLEILVDLPSADTVQIGPAAKVYLGEWGGLEELEGQMRWVEPTGFTKISALGIEEQRVNVIIDFTSPPETWRRLGHGFRVAARIVVWERNDVLKVPVSALFRVGAEWAAFVDADGVAERRIVTLGRHNGIEAEVLDGLGEGVRVIVHPSDRIADGVEIEARPD